ncbi:MAG: hypothetical protein CL763_02790 [Chloroflexi bacterium]|nr:hypothetical protein [Chloroflexota bacterium]MQF86836.1 hypothetical protein [SAR202 cluster bacterium]|tara:strand:+ start:9137 stop:9553 length:417 start_codon:yes stop_codon:yes gene_type:complete
MNYLVWSFLALALYGIAIAFLKISLKSIHPAIALIVTNSSIVLLGFAWWFIEGTKASKGIGVNYSTGALVLTSLVLAGAIFSLYRALHIGPASVVAPIFSMNLVIAASIGFLILGEPFKFSYLIGIGLAVAALAFLIR